MDAVAAPLDAAFILAGMYALEGRLGGSTSERFWTRRRRISAAAGVPVAYVFVDALPELGLDHIVLQGMAPRRKHRQEHVGLPLHVAGFAACSALIGYLLQGIGARRNVSSRIFNHDGVGHSLGEEHRLLHHERGQWLLGVTELPDDRKRRFRRFAAVWRSMLSLRLGLKPLPYELYPPVTGL